MPSIAKITLIGNVGSDPVIKSVGNGGMKVSEFSIAVNEVTGRGESRQEYTTWYRVSFWNNQAETVMQLIKKGTLIYVEGKITLRPYTDRDGNQKISAEVRGSDFQLLLSERRENSGGSNGGYSNQRGGDNMPAEQGFTAVAEDDDLPF